MQNIYEGYEEGINFIDMLWFCVSRWKSIVAIGLIGLILGCGFSILKSPENTINIEDQGNENGDAAYELELTEQLVTLTEQRLLEIQNYVENSKLMKINPYDLYQGTISYRINALQGELDAINDTLYSFVKNGKLAEQLENETGLYESKDLSQMMSFVQNGADVVAITDMNTPGQISVTITLLGKTQGETEILLAQTQKAIDLYLNELKGEYNVNNFSVLEMTVVNTQSTVLAEYQDKIRTKIYNEQQSLRGYMSVLKEVDDIDIFAQTEYQGINKKEMVLYGGIGFVVGCFIAIAVWILLFCMGQKLCSISNLEVKFNVKQFGTIQELKKLNIIDRWIAKKRGKIYGALSVEEQRNLVFFNVMNEIKKKDTIKKICLISSLNDCMEEASLLKENLESEGFVVEKYSNIIGNTMALKKVMMCDAAIVLENKDVSKTILVQEEINLLKEHVDNVLGLILVNGKK
ncbi:MAG: hypothetical protein ACI4TK_14345 [Agathobacter sp.]